MSGVANTVGMRMFLKCPRVAQSAPSWFETHEQGPRGAPWDDRLSTAHFTYSAGVCITPPMRPVVNPPNLMNRKVDFF